METSTAIQSIPIEQLTPNPWNRKNFDPAAMQDLVSSIKAGGIHEPLIVRPTVNSSQSTASGNGSPAVNCELSAVRYEIASGNRRWLAAQKVGLKEVPCLVKGLSDQQVSEMNIVDNIQREDISPLEMAKMVKGYMNQFKKTQQDAATAFGKSQPWVSNLIGFLQMPQDVLENISALIIPWEPLQVIKRSPQEVQMQVSKELKAGNLKPEGVVSRCHALAGAHHPPAPPPPVFSAGGQKFTFTKKGQHLTIVTDAEHLDMLDVFMQNMRVAFVDYMQSQSKPKEASSTAG